MNWRRVDKWHQQADDYHYRVAAARSMGTTVYQAFYTKDRKSTVLCSSYSADECRRVAEAHKKVLENE